MSYNAVDARLWPARPTAEDHVALRVGRALLALHRDKVERGQDYCVHSSWCSDQPLAVVLVRERGKRLGQPTVDGKLVWALERAAEKNL